MSIKSEPTPKDLPDSGEQEQARLAKMRAMSASGEAPYKLGFERSGSVGDVVARHHGLEAGTETTDFVRLAGRVRVLRKQGRLVFADLSDWTGRIQLFAKADNLGERFADLAMVDIGDWVGVWGNVMTTRKGELSVAVEGFEILSKCLRPLPEKWHGLKDVELRYRQRYLDLITSPRAREVLEARSQIVATMRSWLQERGFIEVETPILQPIPGGALARPFVTFHETLGIDLYMRIAPELYLKRLVVGGVEKVFEINRNFRNEGVSTQHNPEFTMLELYQAFGDYETMATLLEELIRATALAVCGTLKFDYQGRELDLESPFRRARIVDLVREAGVDPDGDLAAECERVGVKVDPKWSWGKLLVEIYEKKVEPFLFQPTFAMDYPRDMSPLAREHRSDPRFTEHLDLVICGMEIAPAYSELIDPIEQRLRFEEQASEREHGDDDAHRLDEDFLRSLEFGMPPTGGLGLGIDRLAMLLTDSASIREVILFPALKPG